MIEPGELLRLARAEKKWSQRDLATAAGVSRGVVSKIEGGALPTWRTLAALLDAAGIDLTPVPAAETTFDVDALICAHLMCHPLDRLANHGFPAELIIALEGDARDGARVVSGPATAAFWLPPRLGAVSPPHRWHLTDATHGATYPVRPEAPQSSIRVVGPRAVLGAVAPLGRAAHLWDELVDRDPAGRRDAQHRDPALDDRAERAAWPQNMEGNIRARRPLDYYRRAPWAIRRQRFS